jgi:hypothetical protein
MARFAIEKYVDQKNQWGAIFGQPKLSLLSAADRKKIAQDLDCDLSPENLSCDGELTRSQIQTKYNFLHRAASELLAIDPSVEIHEFY